MSIFARLSVGSTYGASTAYIIATTCSMGIVFVFAFMGLTPSCDYSITYHDRFVKNFFSVILHELSMFKLYTFTNELYSMDKLFSASEGVERYVNHLSIYPNVPCTPVADYNDFRTLINLLVNACIYALPHETHFLFSVLVMRLINPFPAIPLAL